MKKSNIYIGEVIKQVIAEKQVTKAELARRLGVKPQSVDYLLTRKSIDTDTLYSLSLALDYDFAVLYSIKKEHALATDEESSKKIFLLFCKLLIIRSQVADETKLAAFETNLLVGKWDSAFLCGIKTISIN